MRIGYPCINWTLDCKTDRTFRLKSYSEDRLIETVENNLDCLLRVLEFNVRNNILFFRITSDLVPFASHPICQFRWQDFFREKFEKIGAFIKRYDTRISMHPDQFVLINSKDKKVFERSRRELLYHAEVLSLMKLDTSVKIQIHIGGVYKDKMKSIERFIKQYNRLDSVIRKRLVIENDDVSYTLSDCLRIHSRIGVPVLFDILHHRINSSGQNVEDALTLISSTWKRQDGVPMVDYSSQKKGKRQGRHAETIDMRDFKNFLVKTKDFDFDIMLEIKDKEKSALKAVEITLSDVRFLKIKIPKMKKFISAF